MRQVQERKTDVRTTVLAAVILVGVLAAVMLLAAAPLQATEPLPRATPAEMGVDAAQLTAALDNAEDFGFTWAMVVVRDGHVIDERNWLNGWDIPMQSRSVTKSVMSTLIGIAIDRGYIDGLTVRMVDLLPEDYIPQDAQKHEILLYHLLTMTAGFEYDEDAEVVPWLNSADPIAWILDRPLVTAPGTAFNYNTAASHLLSVMLTEATGMTALEFADEHLFGPLGITERRWNLVGDLPNGGHNLFLRTEDVAKLGVLFVNGGLFAGQQVVPEYWTNQATYPLVTLATNVGQYTRIGYGFEWWLYETDQYRMYSAIGWGGQYSFCVPALNLVVSVHSTGPANPATARAQENAIRDLIVDQIIPAVSDQRQWNVTGVAVPELNAFDEMMQEAMQDNDIRNASLAVAKDGRLVLAHGYTWDDPGAEIVQPTSLFRTGTAGVAMTSIAVHRLIQDGRLSYDTPVASTLDLQPPEGQARDPRLDLVTLDHLLTHTVGWDTEDGAIDPLEGNDDVVAEGLGTEAPPTQDEIQTFMAGQPMQFEPGSDWAYCSVGYMLLDQLAQWATGEDFVEWTLNNVFRKAGVGRARMGHMLEHELAPGEVDYDGVFQGDPYRLNLENAFAAGGQVMSAPDLARVLSVLFDSDNGGGLLESENIDSMMELPFPASEALGYGRGWITEDFFHFLGHTAGWMTEQNTGASLRANVAVGPGTHGVAMWHPSGVTLVLLTNKDPMIENFDDLPVISDWPDHDLWPTVGISDQASGQGLTEAWIPVVSHAEGVGNSSWRTDVDLLNRSTLASSVRLRFYAPDGYVDHSFEVAPGEALTLDDVVADLDQSGSAPMRVFAHEPVSVATRTYNDGAGTFGQAIDASCATCGLETGDQVVLMQLREDDIARSNIGIFNGFKRSAQVQVSLFEADGMELSTFTVEVPAEQTLQLNRPFVTYAGRSDISSGYAVIDVVFGRFIEVYGSLVDNGVNDPTTIPAKKGVGAQQQWIAAAARVSGAHDSEWMTDLAVLNRSGAAASVEIVYRSESTVRQTYMVQDGQQLALADVVGLLGERGAGTLEVVSDHPVFVHSRTFSAGSEGNFGQGLDGVVEEELADAGDERWLVGLRQNDGFRTNVGCLNTGDDQAIVRVHLYEGAGEEVAAPQQILAAGERLQLQEPFSTVAGRDDIRSGYARVTVESGSGVLCYASVVDNTTNDPTTVKALR